MVEPWIHGPSEHTCSFQEIARPDPESEVLIFCINYHSGSNKWLQTFKIFQESIRNYTTKLQEFSYDPASWLRRGKILLAIGYPELAAGDLHKTRLLISFPQIDKGDLGKKVLLQIGARMGLNGNLEHFANIARDVKTAITKDLQMMELDMFQSLATTFLALGCFLECLEICRQSDELVENQEWVTDVRSHAERHLSMSQNRQHPNLQGKDKEEKQESLRNGHVLLRPYPWVHPDLLRRNETVIEARRQSIEQALQGKRSIAKSNIRNYVSNCGDATDTYGMVALRDIATGEILLHDTTIAIAASNYEELFAAYCCSVLKKRGLLLKCCRMNISSRECAKSASRNFHSATCSNENTSRFCSPLMTATEHEMAHDNLLFRLLSMAVQSKRHPLKVPLIHQLVAPYSRMKHVAFNFGSRVVRPIEMLQQLGVDVFPKQDYDTWILHTIRERMSNNMHEGRAKNSRLLALHPLFVFFNHSCMPKATWDALPGHPSTLGLTAAVKIQKGEEISIAFS